MIIDTKATRNENDTVTMVASISKADWDKEVKNAVKILASRANIKGFRNGKVPVSVIRRMYGDQAINEMVVDSISRRELPNMYEKAELDVIGTAEISDIKAGDEATEITYIVPVMPEIELKEWKNLGVDKAAYAVSDEEVDKAYNGLLEAHATEQLVEEGVSEAGDSVEVNITVEAEGEDEPKTFNGHTVVLNDDANEAVAAALTGKKSGDEVDVELEDAGVVDASLMGKKGKAHYVIGDIYRPEMPEITEEFVAEVSADPELKTADDLRKLMRERLEAEATVRYKDALLDKVRELNPIDLPQGATDRAAIELLNSMAREYGAHDFNDFSEKVGSQLTEVLVKSAQEQSVPLVHADLILEAIAKENNVSFTDEEVDEEAKKYAKENGLKEEDFLENLNRRAFREHLMLDKALDILTDAQ